MKTEIRVNDYEILPLGWRLADSEFRWARVEYTHGEWMVSPYKVRSKVFAVAHMKTKREADKAARAWVRTGRWDDK